jgi:hypothetical protein
MEPTRFDALTRTLATGANRRTAVRGLAAGAAALAGLGVVARGATEVGAQAAAEGNRGPGKKCNKNSQCGRGLRCGNDGECEFKGRNCGRTGDACDGNQDCCGNRSCRKGSCER